MQRKTISFLGDSITTLANYNPENYNIYYEGYTAKEYNVDTIDKTYWGKLLEYYNLDLFINNSYSGSTLTKTNFLMDFPAAISPLRTDHLSKNGINPDIIYIFIGINDFYNNVPLNNDDNFKNFYYSFNYLINRLYSKYPTSEIWVSNLPYPRLKGDLKSINEKNNNGNTLEDYNKVINEVALKHNCKLINIANINENYETLDGVHPNNEGMINLFNMIIKNI